MADKHAEPKKTDDIQDLEKLRDVLFGNQFRENEKKYVRLEEKVSNQFENLRNEIRLRLNSLEDIEKSLAKDYEDFKKNTIKTESEMRQFFLKSVRELSEEMHRIQKDFLTELADEVKLLDDEKVDRNMMASMFGDIIVKLNAEKGIGKLNDRK